jgi:hypothetical protein
MSVAFTKFNKFVLQLGNKVYDLDGSLKVALTNTSPTAATDTVYADLTAPIASTNLSGATPFNLVTVFTEQSGSARMWATDLTLTATGSVGPFRYVVLYDNNATNDELIGFYDYGSSVTMSSGDTFTLDFDAVNGVLTIA